MPTVAGLMPALLIFRIATTVWLALILASLYRRVRHEVFLRYWALSWSCLAVSLSAALMFTPPLPSSGFSIPMIIALCIAQVSAYAQAAFLSLAALGLQGERPGVRIQAYLLGSAVVLGLATLAAAAIFQQEVGARLVVMRLPRLILCSGAAAWFALIYWRRHSGAQSLGGILTVVFSALYAAHLLLLGASLIGWITYGPSESPLASTIGGIVPLGITSGMFMLALAHADAANRARLEHEAQLALAIEGSGVGLWDWRVQTGEATFSRRWAEIVGYTLEELSPLSIQTWTRLCHPEDLKKSQDALERHFAGKTLFYECEARMLHRDGRWIWVLDRGRVAERDAEGRALRMTGTHLDITEHKHAEIRRSRLEEELQQAQKMESIGRLAGGIAHDFNNLLTVINGYSELLLDFLDKSSNLRGFAAEIKKAGNRAAELTRQLLAFSRKQIVQPRSINLNSVIADTEKMLRRLIGEDIELSVSADPALGRVIADPFQIDQVLINLAANARDAMPHGGRLILETSNVDLDAGFTENHGQMIPGPYVMLAVSDTGIGMDSSVRSRVFEPFFTTKEVGRGTGLGLATVYGIVKQAGGYIWVYSEPGQGATFKIYLPRTEIPPSHSADAEPPVHLKLRGTETILVVEDEGEVRKLIVNVLGSCGCRLLEAANAEMALRLAQSFEGTIHILITDVVMPGMTGRTLAEKLLAVRSDMKVLLISGYTESSIMERGDLPHGVEFLQKPFSPQALVDKVAQVLGTAD